MIISSRFKHVGAAAHPAVDSFVCVNRRNRNREHRESKPDNRETSIALVPDNNMEGNESGNGPSKDKAPVKSTKRMKTDCGESSTSSSAASTSSAVEPEGAAAAVVPEEESAAGGSDTVQMNPRSSSARNRSYRTRNLEEESDDTTNDSTNDAPEMIDLGHPDFISSMLRNTSDPDSQQSVESDDYEQERQEAAQPPVLRKAKPKHKWFMVPSLIDREYGSSSKFKSNELFQQRCYGSLHCVQRLELMYKLEKHQGCVNSLNFHPDGTLLASGSDDLNCVIWNWPTGEELITFDTKHRGNVFQTKFMPLSGDLHVVTCARDGQVKLHQVSRNEGLRSSRKLGSHKGPVHKLSLLKDQPHVVLSAGEDGCVIRHDVRVNKPEKIVTVTNLKDDRKIPLYSINSHPLNMHEFCISGRDHMVRIYDMRKGNIANKIFFPGHIKKKVELSRLHVTCAVYNHNGTEILASYNNCDIYLFDTTTNNHTTIVHRYSGHRNGATIKGVNFFGPKSEYVVSGSDCGNVFFWDKNTEAIVQWMLADDIGVVNCLEPHPQLPMICTSGLDWDVKVWVPSCEHEPDLKGLPETVKRNLKCRMLWLLWRNLNTTERRALLFQDADGDDDDLAGESSSTSSGGSSGNDDDEIVPPLR